MRGAAALSCNLQRTEYAQARSVNVVDKPDSLPSSPSCQTLQFSHTSMGHEYCLSGGCFQCARREGCECHQELGLQMCWALLHHIQTIQGYRSLRLLNISAGELLQWELASHLLSAYGEC